MLQDLKERVFDECDKIFFEFNNFITPEESSKILQDICYKIIRYNQRNILTTQEFAEMLFLHFTEQYTTEILKQQNKQI